MALASGKTEIRGFGAKRCVSIPFFVFFFPKKQFEDVSNHENAQQIWKHTLWVAQLKLLIATFSLNKRMRVTSGPLFSDLNTARSSGMSTLKIIAKK